MADRQVNVFVLGAGIVGVSTALQLKLRPGVSVVLIDRKEPGMETSYGNAGVIEFDTIFPPAFPKSLWKVLMVGLKQTTEANYHIHFLPKVAPWLFAFKKASSDIKLIETAADMRALFNVSLSEHKALMKASGALPYLKEEGWLKVHRTEKGFRAGDLERRIADISGIPYAVLTTDQACELEPNLRPCFLKAVHWKSAANVTNPLKVTQAYFEFFKKNAGVFIKADASEITYTKLDHGNCVWRIKQGEDTFIAHQLVVALGPWSPDFLKKFGIDLPLGIKRGYHRHYKNGPTNKLNRPVMDAEKGYYMASMEQGIRVTTGAEFADRDAPPTPAQFDRLLPFARQLLPIGDQVNDSYTHDTWMGCRPCFPDSRPVIGRAPGRQDMWLAYGHAHWGLTLGPATGRLLADMITNAKPFCDPAPYRAERFM